ncbi:hypothetical protein ACKS0A_02271 [Histoplasma ohiense]
MAVLLSFLQGKRLSELLSEFDVDIPTVNTFLSTKGLFRVSWLVSPVPDEKITAAVTACISSGVVMAWAPDDVSLLRRASFLET